MKTEQERLLALSAIFQVACLVDRIARTGSADSDAVETSLFSIFQTDAETVEAVFHDARHLRFGLRCLVRQLTEEHSDRVDVTRYALQLMHLAGKLGRQPDRIKAISDGIETARGRLEAFPMTHTNILAQLADLYVEHISRLSSRIMVNGEPLHLNNPDNVYRIRSLLLAGIRAAWLWQQCGGRRRQMIFSRRKIHDQAKALLEDLSRED